MTFLSLSKSMSQSMSQSVPHREVAAKTGTSGIRGAAALAAESDAYKQNQKEHRRRKEARENECVALLILIEHRGGGE